MDFIAILRERKAQYETEKLFVDAKLWVVNDLIADAERSAETEVEILEDETEEIEQEESY